MAVVTKIAYSLKESAEAANIGRNTLLKAIRSGELPAAFIGAEDSQRKRIIIRVSDLDGWLERQTVRK